MKNAKQLDGCYTRLLGTEKKMILSPVSCCGPQPKVVDQEEGHPRTTLVCLRRIQRLRNVLEQDKCSWATLAGLGKSQEEQRLIFHPCNPQAQKYNSKLK